MRIYNIQNLTDEGRIKGRESHIKKAAERNFKIVRIISQLPDSWSLRQYADYFNRSGYKTVRGNEFQANTIKRLIDKYLKK